MYRFLRLSPLPRPCTPSSLLVAETKFISQSASYMSVIRSSKSQPTFAKQGQLPRLPIPPLNATLDKYLATLKPLLSSADFAHSQQAVSQFISSGLGPSLQQRLIDYDTTQPYSWLETWWYRLAYHSWREPVLIHSNWFILFQDSILNKSEMHTSTKTPALKGYTDVQLKRAAGLVSNYLDYKQLLDSQLLPPESTRQGPLDMHQYSQMFGVTRIPAKDADHLVQFDKSLHIVVSAKSHFFVVFVNDQFGNRIAVKEIEAQIRAALALLPSINESPIGILTGVHRDVWTEARTHFIKIDESNKTYLHWIESSLFNLALDDYAVGQSLEALAQNTFHGHRGQNRWFDKALTLIVSNDGRAGMNGEHSPCDALVPSWLVDYAAANEPAVDPANAVHGTSIEKPFLLTWKTDAKMQIYLKNAQTKVDEMVKDSQLSLLHYKEFGTDEIKKICKVSPDAFVQMVMQVAFYKMHKTFTPTYETASTRKFLHGRTETCRTLSNDSAAFVKAFLSSTNSSKVKYEALQKACTAHVKYISEAMDGHGCDRHLMGLRMCMTAEEKDQAEIFKDKAYGQNSWFRLSTSGLSAGDRFLGTGFGSVVPDGYGINYMAGPKMIKFGIESKVSCAETSSPKFMQVICDTLKEMKDVCADANANSGLGSKL